MRTVLTAVDFAGYVDGAVPMDAFRDRLDIVAVEVRCVDCITCVLIIPVQYHPTITTTTPPIIKGPGRHCQDWLGQLRRMSQSHSRIAPINNHCHRNGFVPVL